MGLERVISDSLVTKIMTGHVLMSRVNFDKNRISHASKPFGYLYIDQFNVIVFIRAYWPRDNNFDHVTFYCGGPKPFRSMQCPLS